MRAYTKSPWRVLNDVRVVGPQHGLQESLGSNQEIRLTAMVQTSRGEREANARLIAAAPELLEAYLGLVVTVSSWLGICGVKEPPQVTAALAKARGIIQQINGE